MSGKICGSSLHYKHGPAFLAVGNFKKNMQLLFNLLAYCSTKKIFIVLHNEMAFSGFSDIIKWTFRFAKISYFLRSFYHNLFMRTNKKLCIELQPTELAIKRESSQWVLLCQLKPGNKA